MKRTLAVLGLVLLGTALPRSARAQSPPPTQCVTTAVAQGTANAITIAPLPCAGTTNLLILSAAVANTSGTVTLQPLGSLPQPITTYSGGAIAIGDIGGPGYRALLNSTGFSWILLNPATSTSALPAIPSQTVLSNVTGGSATAEPNTLGAILDGAFGTTQGTIIYRGAGAWTTLAPGTSGYALITPGVGGNPGWGPSGGGSGAGLIASEVQTISGTNTFSSSLVHTPSGGLLEFFINGQGFPCVGSGTPCGVTGTAPTWNAAKAFALTPSDSAVVVYTY